MTNPQLPEGVREFVWWGRRFYAYAPYALRDAVTMEPTGYELKDNSRLVQSSDLPAIEAKAVERERFETERLRAEVRYHKHHERKAVEELDGFGVEKVDDEDRMDSTDDSAGQEWSLYMRIRFLGRRAIGHKHRAEKAERERDQARKEERKRLGRLYRNEGAEAVEADLLDGESDE